MKLLRSWLVPVKTAQVTGKHELLSDRHTQDVIYGSFMCQTPKGILSLLLMSCAESRWQPTKGVNGGKEDDEQEDR